MVKQPSPRGYWFAAFLTSAAIIATVPVARPLQNLLKAKFGTGIFQIFTLMFVIAAVAVFYKLVWKPPASRWRRLVFFGVICGVYTLRLTSLNVQVERFHLLEYGALALFIALGCARRRCGWTGYGWAVAAAFLVGMGDELFQWAWPERYGEWRDVLINVQGSVLALIALAALAPDPGLHRRSSVRQWSNLAAAFAVIAALSGFFFNSVQVFGFLHSHPNTGQFKSVFSPDHLASIDTDAYRRMIDPSENDSLSPAVLAEQRYWYEREGKEHFDRAHFLVEQNRVDEAKREYLIATGHYAPYIQVNQLSFTQPVLQKITQPDPPPADAFTSSILNFVVVRVRPPHVRIISLGITVFFIVLAVLLRSLHKTKFPVAN